MRFVNRVRTLDAVMTIEISKDESAGTCKYWSMEYGVSDQQ